LNNALDPEMQPVDMTRAGKPKFVELRLGEPGEPSIQQVDRWRYSCMRRALCREGALIAALHLVLHGKD